MAHRVGNLFLPAPSPPFGPTRPDEQNTAALDPALTVLGAFFKALIERYCGDAWAAIAPGEPVVRKLVVGHDPEDLDFSDNDTPLLAVWRENETGANRLTDANGQQSTQVNVMWVPAPADEQKLAARTPFYNVFTKAMLLAYANERDPCWIRRGDESSEAARAYGSPVMRHAGIDGWSYSGTRREQLVIAVAGQQYAFPGYLAAWTILESTENDPTAFGSTIDGVRIGSERTAIHIDITDKAGDGALIRQSALVPPDDP